MSEQFDEFMSVVENARVLGVETLAARRVQFVDRLGAGVSGIRWGDRSIGSVYLHGGGLNAHAWDSTILASGRAAVALDLPGHGDSDWRDDFDYSPATMGRTIADVLAQAASGPVTLVGHSLGGFAAIAAAAATDQVARLVLVDISPGRRPTPGSDRIRAFFDGPESYESLSELVDVAIAKGLGTNPERVRSGLLLNTRVRADGRVELKHHLAHAPAGRELDYDPQTLWEPLSHVGIPVLLVYGTRGVLERQMVEELLARVPGSGAVAIEAGHNVHRDAPGLLAGALQDWEFSAGRSRRTSDSYRLSTRPE